MSTRPDPADERVFAAPGDKGRLPPLGKTLKEALERKKSQ
jgi:hypothetical protein